MDVEKILAEYDGMFATSSLAEIEEYLVRNLRKAEQQSEIGVEIILLNEIIGFCRDTTQREKALAYCNRLLEIMKESVWSDTTEYATSLLNIANAYRAFGLFAESMNFYQTVLGIYQVRLPEKDFNFASLYNNWSLLYQELEEYENAREMLLKSLEIVDSYEAALIPQATTRTNLATTLIQIGTKEAYQEAMEYLRVALDIFKADGERDFHYGAALAAMGDASMYQKKYKEAAAYYERGLAELEKHVGRNDNYKRVQEKYEYAMGFCEAEKNGRVHKTDMQTEPSTWASNLERSKAFYEQYGKAMIRTYFPDYEDRIAVGLVGEGSDCFGFDDLISEDHDYGIGFCMWLIQEDYEKIGEALQQQYNRLVMTYAEEIVSNEAKNCDRFLADRRGVFSINRFYNGLLGSSYDFEHVFSKGNRATLYKELENSFWKEFDTYGGEIREWNFATVTNGEVFEDTLGLFTAVRDSLLAYYPEKFWRRKLAQRLHEFSQYAQSNYPRMMARRDEITAGLCIAKAVEAVMDIVYLLEKKYAPYYKWKKKGLEALSMGKRVLPLLDKAATYSNQRKAWEGVKYNAALINQQDDYVVLFEKIAGVLLEELKRQNLVYGRDYFMENYVNQILDEKDVKNKLIDKIIDLEWNQFDKVKNEGGRADCQDDFNTFSIMRKSQYLAWTEELLESYCSDLQAAESKGWNLIMEKYARMMASTAPDRYESLKMELPGLSEERMTIQEEIIKIQVAWMEEFAAKYPKMAGNSRSIHTYEDNAYNTSYETYLRGEMGTYSEQTFLLYGRFIAELSIRQRNLAMDIMENTVRLYGYHSLEDAESRL